VAGIPPAGANAGAGAAAPGTPAAAAPAAQPQAPGQPQNLFQVREPYFKSCASVLMLYSLRNNSNNAVVVQHPFPHPLEEIQELPGLTSKLCATILRSNKSGKHCRRILIKHRCCCSSSPSRILTLPRRLLRTPIYLPTFWELS
jgi:hypothetical protein